MERGYFGIIEQEVSTSYSKTNKTQKNTANDGEYSQGLPRKELNKSRWERLKSTTDPVDNIIQKLIASDKHLCYNKR